MIGAICICSLISSRQWQQPQQQQVMLLIGPISLSLFLCRDIDRVFVLVWFRLCSSLVKMIIFDNLAAAAILYLTRISFFQG